MHLNATFPGWQNWMETFGDIQIGLIDAIILFRKKWGQKDEMTANDSHSHLEQGLGLEPSAPACQPRALPAQAVSTSSVLLQLQNLAPQNLSWNWTSEPKKV